jgi:hypothetical protein
MTRLAAERDRLAALIDAWRPVVAAAVSAVDRTRQDAPYHGPGATWLDMETAVDALSDEARP